MHYTGVPTLPPIRIGGPSRACWAGKGRSLFSLKKHCVKPFHLSFLGLCMSHSVGTLGLHNALLKLLQEIPAVFGPRVLYSVVSPTCAE